MEFKINAKRDEIARAIREHLGGGAYKKRLNDNTIGRIQKLAKDYASASDAKTATLLNTKELLEICHND